MTEPTGPYKEWGEGSPHPLPLIPMPLSMARSLSRGQDIASLQFPLFPTTSLVDSQQRSVRRIRQEQLAKAQDRKLDVIARMTLHVDANNCRIASRLTCPYRCMNRVRPGGTKEQPVLIRQGNQCPLVDLIRSSTNSRKTDMLNPSEFRGDGRVLPNVRYFTLQFSLLGRSVRQSFQECLLSLTSTVGPYQCYSVH